jgi:phosphate acetyltransferase
MNQKQKFIEQIFEQAQQNPARILYPEADMDARVLEGALKSAQLGLAKPILFGDLSSLTSKIQQYGSNLLELVEIFDPTIQNTLKEHYIKQWYLLTKDKGNSLEQAHKDLGDFHHFCAFLLKHDRADAIITGATSTTAETLRPLLKIIGTKEKYHRVSGFFFILLEERALIFSDCAVNIDPSAEQLAEIAIDTAETAIKFGMKPKVAFLSFSTHGSANHPCVEKVARATEIAKQKRPDLAIDGELQVDAALVPSIAKRKLKKDSPIQGDANILIFPNLESGNIAYKLTERLANAFALGPVFQGLAKPVNDLSRGCSMQDVINISAITSIEVNK